MHLKMSSKCFCSAKLDCVDAAFIRLVKVSCYSDLIYWLNVRIWCIHLIRLEKNGIIKVKTPLEINLRWQISPLKVKEVWVTKKKGLGILEVNNQDFRLVSHLIKHHGVVQHHFLHNSCKVCDQISNLRLYYIDSGTQHHNKMIFKLLM